jgi:hypothetical protein
LAHHEIAYSALVLGFCATLAVPLLVAYRWGLLTGSAPALVWAVGGFAVFYVTPGGLGFFDALGVAIVVFFFPWFTAAVVGVLFASSRRGSRQAA